MQRYIMRTIFRRTRSPEQHHDSTEKYLIPALNHSRYRHHAFVEGIMSRSDPGSFTSNTVSAAMPTFHLPQDCQESTSILQTKDCAYMPLRMCWYDRCPGIQEVE